MAERNPSLTSRKDIHASPGFIWDTLLEHWGTLDETSEPHQGLVINRELTVADLMKGVDMPRVLNRLAEISVSLSVELTRLTPPSFTRDGMTSAAVEIVATPSAPVPLPINHLEVSLSLSETRPGLTTVALGTYHQLGRFNPLRKPLESTMGQLRDSQLAKLAHAVESSDRAA